MLEEITVLSCDVTETIKILEQERIERIKHGDGDVAVLDRIIEALGSADRIVIV